MVQALRGRERGVGVMRTRSAALAVSVLLNPGLLLGVFLGALASTREPEPRRLVAAALAFGFATVVPLTSVALLWRRGIVGDLDLRVRRERQAVYVTCGASYACGAAALALVGARWVAGALVLVLVTAALAAILNRFLKVSIHAMTLAGVAVGSIVVVGLRAWPITLVLPLGAWARWAVGAHTPAELVTGAALGGTVALMGFGALSVLLGT